jgi:LPXTG-site transpeptidase (sortase) family protein
MHRLAFFLSAVLLVLAIGNGYLTYKEGDIAEKNAAESLEIFEQLVLKTEEIEPQNTIEPLARAEKVETIEEDIALIEVPQATMKPIAKVQIERIGLNVSVLPEWSYELLDISVNKFSGPDPNELGNFIVIGHNYINKAHFGSLHLVQVGDNITLTDLSGRTLTYEVYEVLIIKADEVEKLESSNALALTLVTCDTNNTHRLVVKSKASTLQ